MADILAQGRFLRLVREDGWEYVERSNATGVVVIVAATDNGELILVEQPRKPVGRVVVELPAGLVGDEGGPESLAEAAGRELVEETGFEAAHLEMLFEGPTSAGLTNETVTVFRATGLRQVHAGGGVEGEQITVRLVPIPMVRDWLKQRAADGLLIDPKIFAALYFLGGVG